MFNFHAAADLIPCTICNVSTTKYYSLIAIRQNMAYATDDPLLPHTL